MRVITLMENTAESDSDLIAKHGLSLYIQTADKKILFDTGPDASLIHNAQSLGVDLTDIDLLVISHAHYDHGGGMEEFLKLNTKAPVFLSTKVKGEYFAQRSDTELQYIGLNQEVLEAYATRLHFIEGKTEISSGITLLPTTEHTTFVPKALLLQKQDGELVKDSFEHELVMVIEDADAIHIITGCSHNGIINMVQSVKKEFPQKEIKTLIGGFHLMNTKTGQLGEEVDTVKNIAATLKDYHIGMIFTGHCTGREGLEVLQGILGEGISAIHTGREISI